MAELTAGTDISPDFAAITGFTPEVGIIESPSLATTVDYQTVGITTFGTNSIDLYEDDASTVVYALFAQGTIGYMAICVHGKTATKAVEVWKLQVSGRNRVHDRFGQQRVFRVVFAVTAWSGQTNPVLGTIAA
jgi:hypothetical protein